MATRPMTAADRVPEVGDVLIDTRVAFAPRTVEDIYMGSVRMSQGKGRAWYSLKNAEWWHYISRANNGATTVEE